MEKPPPERNANGEESVPTKTGGADKFKKLTKRLLSVDREELAEQERLWEQTRRLTNQD